MLLNDKEIAELASKGMIVPWSSSLVRNVSNWILDENKLPRLSDDSFRKVLSFGLGSFGYDIRLSDKDFRVFKHIPGTVINPKRFNTANLEPVALQSDDDGDFFIIPAHSYGLGVAVECLEMPSNITAICMGKSTYARCSLIANITPVEAGWKGHLTLEFSNSSSADCRIYANEGIVQLLFLKGNPCSVSYEDRTGKYQGQSEEITIAKV